jgi:hypothetical protein
MLAKPGNSWLCSLSSQKIGGELPPNPGTPWVSWRQATDMNCCDAVCISHANQVAGVIECVASAAGLNSPLVVSGDGEIVIVVQRVAKASSHSGDCPK